MDDAVKKNVSPALGAIVSSVTVATVKASGGMGMVAGWVQQASFDPPMITLAIREGRPHAQAIEECGAFVVNILAQGQTALMERFTKKGESATLSDLAIQTAATGSPVLSDAAAFLDCRFVEKLRTGDHWVYVGEVVDGGMLAGGKPMVYMREDGFAY